VESEGIPEATILNEDDLEVFVGGVASQEMIDLGPASEPVAFSSAGDTPPEIPVVWDE
jgi:hypothetical protein